MPRSNKHSPESDSASQENSGRRHHGAAVQESPAVSAIQQYLPRHYGRVTTNFSVVPLKQQIGIVIPTFSRKALLEKTLNSFRKSNLPERCVLVIVDETNAAKNREIEGFECFENIDFAGGDIGQIKAEFSDVLELATKISACVAFNDAGWIKRELLEPIQRRHTRFGTYIKKSYLRENPEFHQGILRFTQEMSNLVDSDTEDLVASFDMDMPIIKIFKHSHRNMFDSLRVAWDLLIQLSEAQYLVNLDSDTIHKQAWLATLISTYEGLMTSTRKRPVILSAFNAARKKDLWQEETYVAKFDLGGANLFFDSKTYAQFVRDTLVDVGWDIELSRKTREQDGLLIALRESLIQHIGKEGMWSKENDHDFSTTFKA